MTITLLLVSIVFVGYYHFSLEEDKRKGISSTVLYFDKIYRYFDLPFQLNLYSTP